MKKVLIIIFIVITVGLIFLWAQVDTKRHLRGAAKPSSDGKTYLVVADDNGGLCGPITVDGKNWPHKLNTPGLITPGVHTIECGGKIPFEIPSGTTFIFDYWGP